MLDCRNDCATVCALILTSTFRMNKKRIDPKLASVAATFFAPTYQRLRLRDNGHEVDLLCFVNEPNAKVKQLLEHHGVTPTKRFLADCFQEIWEISHETLLRGPLSNEPNAIDQKVCDALGCGEGRFSSAAGILQWSDRHEQPNERRHVQSRLLVESSARRSR